MLVLFTSEPIDVQGLELQRVCDPLLSLKLKNNVKIAGMALNIVAQRGIYE